MYSYQFPAVFAMMRAFVKANFTAQGETPRSLPSTTTAGQIATLTGDYPLTALQIHHMDFDRAASSLSLRMQIIVHHIRETEGGTGEATMTALQRLCALGVALESDYKLTTVGGTAVPVELVQVHGILIGDENPVQSLLDANNQEASLAAVGLLTEVTWWEGQ